MNMKGKKIFVSGGAGVIGQQLVKILEAAGATLLVGDLKQNPYWVGDLNNITPKELLDFAPDCFFHLAATFERTEETPQFWQENYHHNIKLSHYLLDILKDCSQLKKIIFASSYLIYEPDEHLTENSPINPRNLCGMAKLLHEKELAFFPNIQSISARIFRVYGRGSRDIVSRWITALKQNQPIEVYNKQNRFDYIFAEDVAEGLFRLAQSSHTGPVNLGTGHARSISDLLTILKSHFPNAQIHENADQPPFESTQADMTLFQKTTNWLPSTTLEQGVQHLLS